MDGEHAPIRENRVINCGIDQVLDVLNVGNPRSPCNYHHVTDEKWREEVASARQGDLNQASNL